MLRLFAMSWGLGGILYGLASAVLGLWGRASEALGMELTAVHWAFTIPWVLFMAYTEGHRGFHRSFSPRVVARAWALGRDPRPLHVALAPFFCMGFFHGSRRRILVSWVLTFFIVVLVLGVRLMSQPWRGLVDLGVVVGLSWGSVSIAWLALQSFRAGGTDVDPQLPEG